MKKTFSFLSVFVSTFAMLSFTEAGETKTTCDALNDRSCVVLFADGTKVNATGYATVITTP